MLGIQTPRDTKERAQKPQIADKCCTDIRQRVPTSGYGLQ